MELCREIGNSAALRPFVKCEIMPATSKVPNSSASSAMLP